MALSYTIGPLARRLGITPDTLRAWERRYGVIHPTRAPSGRRVYGAEELRRLELLCEAVRQGHAVGTVARQDNAALARLTRAKAQSPQDAAASMLVDRLMAALEKFDDLEFEKALNFGAATLAPWSLIHETLAPLMHRIGTAWERGTLGVVQEHMASTCLRNLIGSLIRLYGGSEAGGRARLALATPSGERHEFGILLAGMVAASLGVRPCLLGGDLLPEEISQAVRMTRVPLVALGVTDLDRVSPAAAQIAVLREQVDNTVEIWVGGTAAAAVVKRLHHPGIRRIRDLSEFRERLEALRTNGAVAEPA